MKYGQRFQEEAVRPWAGFYLDYDEMKQLIKTNTTKNRGQSITIPGHADTALVEFEASFYSELSNQHDRVGLFVKSKNDEIGRRLQFLQATVLRLLAQCDGVNGKITGKRLRKFSKYDAEIKSCGDDLESLERFIQHQRTAFHKILKKYRKWTGSRALSERFNSEILGDPKSFVKIDLHSRQSEYTDLITLLRRSTPIHSEPVSPRQTSRRPSVQSAAPLPPQRYWNEYDYGSDAEDDTYVIWVHPDEGASFPGGKLVASAYKRTKAELEKAKAWLIPRSSPERAPLLGRSGSRTGSDTDVENGAYASSTEFPDGYVAHYATFPSVSDQRLSQYQDKVNIYLMLFSFILSTVFLAMSGTLLATGRHKLRTEVDLGALTGALLGIFLAVSGLLCTVNRSEKLGWIHQGIVTMAFILLCLVGIALLVVIYGN